MLHKWKVAEAGGCAGVAGGGGGDQRRRCVAASLSMLIAATLAFLAYVAFFPNDGAGGLYRLWRCQDCAGELGEFPGDEAAAADGPSPPRAARTPTTLSHIVFGIGASARTWDQRRGYAELWWRPDQMRGHVWLDEEPVSPWPAATCPPYRVSADASRFGDRASAARMARIAADSFLAVAAELGNDTARDELRWFVMGDDDTVFFPDNLVAVLRKYDHGEMYYVGAPSESVEQDVMHSYGMAFGGGGFAVSYPAAAALAKAIDGCLDRYVYFYGSDQRVQACLAELGVPLTREPGFHQGDMMDWTDAYTSIVCNLFAEQVKKGNRPNTHLNSVGYTEVSNRFYQMTGIYLSKMQLKNKWDKLKIKLSAWNRLMKRQTGTGWDRTKGVIDMDDEWWRKARKDIPGCGGFKTKPLQNVDDLNIMFGDIINDETDHWNPMSSNPIIPQNDDTPIEVDLDVGENLDGGGDDIEDNGGVAVNDIEEVSPSIGNAKRRSRVVIEKGKKAKTGTALVIQEKLSEIAEQAKAFTSRKVGEVTVEQVMDLVLDCGAGYGTDEHFIATELFVKKDQRDMFMTLPTKDIRFGWLTRKFNVKYGN